MRVTPAAETPLAHTPPPVQARDRVAAIDLQTRHLQTRRIEKLRAVNVRRAEIRQELDAIDLEKRRLAEVMRAEIRQELNDIDLEKRRLAEVVRELSAPDAQPTRSSDAMRPPKPTPKPAPAHVQAYADLNGQAPTPEERQSAERWMKQRLPRAADNHARAVIAETATSADTVRALAPRPKPGCYIAQGATPRDPDNDGPLRSQTGANEAARVLNRALDEIAQAQPPASRWLGLRRAPDPQKWRLKQWAERAGAVVQRMMTAALSHEIAQLRTWRKRDEEGQAEEPRKPGDGSPQSAEPDEEAKQRREAMRRDSPPRRRRRRRNENEGVGGH